VTEAVAAAIEHRWRHPAAPHISRYIQPELIVRASTAGDASLDVLAGGRGRKRHAPGVVTGRSSDRTAITRGRAVAD
jgi:hypothetical protein